MSGVQQCVWDGTKTIAIADGGLDVASRWFGLDEAAIEKAAGRFARGKNKGKLRGWIVYRKCRVGGWSFPLARVVRPGIIYAHFCATYDEMGRIACLQTDRFVPGAERVDTCYGFDPAAARAKRAAEAAELEKKYAEREARIGRLREVRDLVKSGVDPVEAYESKGFPELAGEVRKAIETARICIESAPAMNWNPSDFLTSEDHEIVFAGYRASR